MSPTRTVLLIAAVGVGLLTACGNTVAPRALPADPTTSIAPESPQAPEPTAPPTHDAPIGTNAPAAGPPPPPEPPAPPELPAPPEPPAAAPPPETKPPAPSKPAPTSASKPYYKSCKEAKAAGAAPMHKGDPGYRAGLDGDSDGVACEK